MSKLEIVPISLAEAQEFVENHHRHLGKVAGAKFQIGLANDDYICGVVVVGRPLARLINDGWTLEVTRCCTDGTKNANSMLYAAAWRTTRAMGYKRLITYTHVNESGTTMKAAGWKCVGKTKGASWHSENRPRIHKGLIIDKYKWEVTSTDDIGQPRSMIKVPMPTDECLANEQQELF